MELLEDLGSVPNDLRKKIREEEEMEVLRNWCRLIKRAESVAEFERMIAENQSDGKSF